MTDRSPESSRFSNSFSGFGMESRDIEMSNGPAGPTLQWVDNQCITGPHPASRNRLGFTNCLAGKGVVKIPEMHATDEHSKLMPGWRAVYADTRLGTDIMYRLQNQIVSGGDD